MHIVPYITLFLIFVLAPSGVLWLCRRVSFFDKVGPVVILYFLGAFIGNLGTMGIRFFPEELPQMQTALNNILVPLAIPLMLFGCKFRRSDTRSQFLSLLFGLIAVVIALIGGYLVFGGMITDAEEPLYAAKVGGMLTGSYTGGTINMASIQKMLNVPEESFVIANTFDMVVCFFYLMFLISLGIPFFRRLLDRAGEKAGAIGEVDAAALTTGQKSNPYSGLASAAGIKSGSISAMATIVIFAVSYLIATTINSLVSGEIFMVVFILLLTSFGIAASFSKIIRRQKYNYDIGMYLIYIFSIVVASMADVSKINIQGCIGILGYIVFVVFVSLTLHVIFARIFRIDADTVIITSVAYINSPPFVPMVAGAMKNRNIIVAGLTIGIFGYAISNYLGLIIFRILSLL